MVSKIIKVLIGVFWPLSLLLSNTPKDFISYILPALLVIASYYVYTKKSWTYIFFIIIIPLISPKLAPLPTIFFLGLALFPNNHNKKVTLLAIVISLLIFAISWQQFKGQTVFAYDYEARQKILRNITLYPNVISARVFQNKPKIIINKFNANFFALIDPNNYFFAYHPREDVINTQNLTKFPFLTIVFLLIGILASSNLTKNGFIIPILSATLLTLSCLTNFDRHDVILWFPITYLVFAGVDISAKTKSIMVKLFLSLFIVLSCIELIRVLII